MEYNSRYTCIDTGNWWYEHVVLNVANGDQIASNCFVERNRSNTIATCDPQLTQRNADEQSREPEHAIRRLEMEAVLARARLRQSLHRLKTHA